MTRFAVVVVNYNTCTELRDCLASLSSASQVVVVDNNSTDGSVAMVRREFPGARVLENRVNPGYGGGANQGVAACDSEYVLVLNSDTVLETHCLRELQRYLDDNPAVGIAAPRLLNADGTLQLSCFPFPGTLRWLLENEPVAPLVGRIPAIRKRLLCHSPPDRATPVPWVLGAALAIRRTAFREVGGFDESFFMYYEEVDLCRRLRERGWQIHHVPSARLIHRGGASTSQAKGEMAVEHFRSTLRFYHRHHRGPRLAFWLGLMRSKMLFRLLRDSAAIPLARDAAERHALRERVGVWRRILQMTPARSLR